MIYFLLAGDMTRPAKQNEPILFTSKKRCKRVPSTVFHNNSYSTFYRIPEWLFHTKFKYNRSTAVYENSLTYGDLVKYAEVWDHR